MAHTHKYIRISTTSEKRFIYRCVLKACTHFIFSQFLSGKLAICWSCENEFEIGDSYFPKKPKCNKCREVKLKIEVLIKLKDTLNRILNEKA